MREAYAAAVESLSRHAEEAILTVPDLPSTDEEASTKHELLMNQPANYRLWVESYKIFEALQLCRRAAHAALVRRNPPAATPRSVALEADWKRSTQS